MSNFLNLKPRRSKDAYNKSAGYYLTASEVSKLCKEVAIYNSAFLANSEEYS